MARRRSNRSRSAQRDTSLIAIRPDAERALLRRASLSLLADNRLFHPERDFRPALFISTTRPARYRDVNVNRRVSDKRRRMELFSPTHFLFDRPRDVTVCVRRKARREVLFAYRRTGKGARAPRHRNYWSDVKCR